MSNHKQPIKAEKNGEHLFGIPSVNAKTCKGFKEVDSLFVDSSGFGEIGEAALTIDQFYAKVKAGLYYGVTDAGQFQVHVGVFEKI